MIRKTAEDYSKYLNLKIDDKLNGLNQIVDDMQTRLEELETLVVLVQQERCNAIGMTGHLSQTTESSEAIKELCSKIDVIEKMVDDADTGITTLEKRVAFEEEQNGLVDSSNKIKNLLMPFFKKPPKPQVIPTKHDSKEFSASEYFVNNK